MNVSFTKLVIYTVEMSKGRVKLGTRILRIPKYELNEIFID